jgi:hypothetical protein
VINTFDVKQNDEYALAFALHLSPFSVSVSLDFPCTPHAYFSERLFYHYLGLRRTSSLDEHKM